MLGLGSFIFMTLVSPYGLSVSLTMVYKLLGILPLQAGFHGWVLPMDLYQSLLKNAKLSKKKKKKINK